ncbi:MAG: DUF1501 domain-containing protein [Gemmataceae bacterium]|nr:DUF1501 domain-containing protein [Gemmataceae bacterium]
MLRILGSRTRLCDRVTRREALVAGLALPAVLGAASSGGPASFGKARACVILHLYGSPPQHETFDPKPDAPSDVRGLLNPIATSVPGLRIGEHLPRTAARMDKVALVRSMTHPYPIHGVAYALSGVPKIDVPMELNPRDGRHWPYIGSVLDRLARGRKSVPTHAALPWKFSSRAEPFRRAGPYGGFLGAGYDPVWAEFQGKATAGDPHRGIDPECRFQVTPPGQPITLDRLDRRRSLLEQLAAARKALPDTGFDRQQAQALELMTSSRLAAALDVRREPGKVRARYGHTLFGQSCLTARRMVEAGVKLVTVFWDEFKEANSAWDTHVRQWSRLKDDLCPGFDHAYSALLDDLAERGMLDSTLVLVTTEHGRTPKLNKEPGGGREHWSGAYCNLLAGGGIKAGAVLGSTDREAGFPREHPVSPKDVLATMYHLLGVPAGTHLADREGRPQELAPGGQVLRRIIA